MRVLVVDDDQSTAELLSRYLTADGFQVVTAFDASQAMSVLSRGQINAVVTDLMMPRLDGRELLRRIRGDPRTSALPVIVLTAFYDDATIDGLTRDGASLYLSKPIDLHPDELSAFDNRCALRFGVKPRRPFCGPRPS